MRVIMSDHGLDTMAVTLDRIARTVENVDELWIKPDYTNMAADLGKVIQYSLPTLMEIMTVYPMISSPLVNTPLYLTYNSGRK